MAKGVPIQGKNPSGKAQLANVTAEGDLKVQLSGNIVTSYTFHESVTDAQSPKSMSVLGKNTLILESSGTATDLRVRFYGISLSGGFIPISGVNISNLDVATETNARGTIWRFDVSGLRSFAIWASPVGGGELTVKAEVM